MKYFYKPLFFFSLFFLLGCSDSPSKTITPSAATLSPVFAIENIKFSIDLPSGWEKVALPDSSTDTFVTNSKDAQLVIKTFPKIFDQAVDMSFAKIKEKILEKFPLTEVTNSDNGFEFSARTSLDESPWYYSQIFFTRPKENKIVVVSCASLFKNKDCKQALDSFVFSDEK